jgi:hypothetical protein
MLEMKIPLFNKYSGHARHYFVKVEQFSGSAALTPETLAHACAFRRYSEV